MGGRLLMGVLPLIVRQVNFALFVTTWNVTEMVDFQYQITIPTSASETYEYTVDWGDGSVTENATGDSTHVYENPGTYQVRISGIFPRINMGGNIENAALLRSVDQWGDVVWSSMEEAFAQCINLDVIAKDFPDFF